MEEKVLFKSEYYTLKEKDGYEYIHEEKCHGAIVAVLPFKTVEGEKQFLLVNEDRPMHGRGMNLYALTGGFDDVSLSIRETVVKEVREEAGFEVVSEELISLGWVYNSKACDTKVYMFAVDVSGKEQEEPISDGDVIEDGAVLQWCDVTELDDLTDIYSGILRDRIYTSFAKGVLEEK